MRTLDRWRTVDDIGVVLELLLRTHRNTHVVKTFCECLLIDCDVSEVIYTDHLHSYGAAFHEIPSLVGVGHQQVISTVRCNNIIQQSHRPTRRRERQQQGPKDENTLKNSRACTPGSPASSSIPEPAPPLQLEDNIKSMRLRRGLQS